MGNYPILGHPRYRRRTWVRRIFSFIYRFPPYRLSTFLRPGEWSEWFYNYRAFHISECVLYIVKNPLETAQLSTSLVTSSTKTHFPNIWFRRRMKFLLGTHFCLVLNNPHLYSIIYATRGWAISRPKKRSFVIHTGAIVGIEEICRGLG